MRRTEADAQETRRTILQAARRVFFERGVSRSSLEEIARTAGVTRGAIYWHFRNKAELFEAIHKEAKLPMQDVLDRLAEAEGADGVEQLEAFCADSLLSLHEDEQLRRLFTVLLLKCEASQEMESHREHLRRSKSETVRSLEVIFGHLQNADSIRSTTEPRILALALHGYMTGLFIDYLRSPSSYRMPADATKLVRHFFSPLRASAVD